MSTRIFSLAKAALLLCGILLLVFPGGNAAAAGSDTVPKPANLDWRAIESDDYRTYITNLQAVGCPAQTIRDIVTADIVGVFGSKREDAIKVRFQDYQFWKADPTQTEARATFESQRNTIDAEMNRVIQELLGANALLPDIHRDWRRLELNHQLDFLSVDKREQTINILLNSEKVNDHIGKLAGGQNITEDTNALQQILTNYNAEKAALQELLSSNEFQLVQFSVSWTSENLRRAMVHFQPTEAEFRVIFAAWQPHDENLARLRANRQDDPGNAEVYTKIKEQMTAERYQEYCDTWWK